MQSELTIGNIEYNTSKFDPLISKLQLQNLAAKKLRQLKWSYFSRNIFPTISNHVKFIILSKYVLIALPFHIRQERYLNHSCTLIIWLKRAQDIQKSGPGTEHYMAEALGGLGN